MRCAGARKQGVMSLKTEKEKRFVLSSVVLCGVWFFLVLAFAISCVSFMHTFLIKWANIYILSTTHLDDDIPHAMPHPAHPGMQILHVTSCASAQVRVPRALGSALTSLFPWEVGGVQGTVGKLSASPF